MSAPPHFPRFIASLFWAAALLLAGGCYHYEERRPVHSASGAYASLPADRPATALIIVIQGECTEAQYLAWRRQVVSYLVERGYIASEDELIGDPAQAQRIIRAIVGEGGFTLSVFNANVAASPPPDLEFTDIYYPADPYFIFGFLYFGEIGPRRLPPCPPDYRPHPRPPDTPPPRYPRYDHDRHRPTAPGPGGRDRPRPPPTEPRDHDRPDQPPTAPPPAHPPHQPPPTGTPSAYKPRPTIPREPREHPRDDGLEPAHPRLPPSHVSPPPPANNPPPPSPKAEKPERKDDDKRPQRPEPER